MREHSRPGQQFGLTLNLSPVTPATDSPADVDGARRLDGMGNRLFLGPILRGAIPRTWSKTSPTS
jgi:beta-glucosidase